MNNLKNLQKPNFLESDTSEIWNTIHKFNKNKNRNPKPDFEGINMYKFIEEFCPSTASYNKPPDTDPDSDLNSLIDLDQPFTLDGLEIAIASCNPHSIPGLDQITNKMVKKAPDNFKTLLLHALNECFSTLCIPQD